MRERKYWGQRPVTTWRQAVKDAMRLQGEDWPRHVEGIAEVERPDDEWVPHDHGNTDELPEVIVWATSHVFFAAEEEGAWYVGWVRRHPEEREAAWNVDLEEGQ